MATWVKWHPIDLERPCLECPDNAGSAYWPGTREFVTRLDELTDERRNQDCAHTLKRPAHFQQTTEDDPRAEWRDVDWDPSPTPPNRT